MAGTAWACPPEPEGARTEQTTASEGEGTGGARHAGHYHRADTSTAAKSEAIKGVRRVGGVPGVTGTISLIFMDYGHGRHKRTIIYATGEYGLKAYDITADPRVPKLVGQLNMPGMWETEDTDFDPERKLIYLSRDPRAFGGNTQTGESGIYAVDASKPETLRHITYVKVPAGHTPPA